MFQKMGDSIVLLIFKSQTGSDKHRYFHGVNMRHFHRHHRQAVGQNIFKIFQRKFRNFHISCNIRTHECTTPPQTDEVSDKGFYLKGVATRLRLEEKWVG